MDLLTDDYNSDADSEYLPGTDDETDDDFSSADESDDEVEPEPTRKRQRTDGIPNYERLRRMRCSGGHPH